MVIGACDQVVVVRHHALLPGGINVLVELRHAARVVDPDVGNGVTSPRILRQVKPAYTSEAMRAKVQGEVLLRCVVLPDGSVGRVEIVKSLDNVFGLDQEAIKAARQWKFVPGTRLGEPVAVRVTIALDFTLR